MSDNGNATPAKKMRRDSNIKDERSTPASLRSLHIDMEEPLVPSPDSAASLARRDMEEEMMERFWLENGVSCAAEIAAKLASSAVRLAAKHTMKEIAMERKMTAYGRPARVGWPGRMFPGLNDPTLASNIPAVWRVSPTVPRLAQAVATPSRRVRRQAESYPDVMGIAPLSPKAGRSTADKLQGELAALERIERRMRRSRAEARRQRTKERLLKRKAAYEEEEETDSDELPELVPFHDCEDNGCVTEDTDEDDQPPQSSATVGRLNVTVNVK